MVAIIRFFGVLSRNAVMIEMLTKNGPFFVGAIKGINLLPDR